MYLCFATITRSFATITRKQYSDLNNVHILKNIDVMIYFELPFTVDLNVLVLTFYLHITKTLMCLRLA